MSQFIVDQSFWNLFPSAKIGVVLLKNYQINDVYQNDIKALLDESNCLAKQYLVEDNFSDNAVVQVYRQAYQKFKTKKGARSSIEALLKRVSMEKPVGSITPLVDIYNAVSLRYALPVGAEDIETFKGDLRLTVTDGGDTFYLIGNEQNQPTLAGEVCYKDDEGAVCRCLNWRDGQRTMITEQTQNAFVVIELLDNTREDDLKAALEMIAKTSEVFLSATTSQAILSKDNPVLSLTLSSC